MKAVVWSQKNCAYCVQAKNLLEMKGIEVEERKIGELTWTKEALLEAVPNARTVPQIFVDDQYIGGFNELTNYFRKAA